MRSITMTMTLLGMGWSIPLAAQGTDAQALVNRLLQPESSEWRSAFMELRQQLRSGNAATVQELQTILCGQLGTAGEPATIRKIGAVLSAASCDQGIALAADKLQAAVPWPTQAAACQAIADLARRRAPQDPQLTANVLSRLESILRDESRPSGVVNEAAQAIAAFGSAGLNVLLRVHHAPGAPRRTINGFYTALSRTGEARALPFLRDALTDPAIHEGLRIEAVHAIGELVAGLTQRDQTIGPAERRACADRVNSYLNADTADQLYGVSLKALAVIEGFDQNPRLRQLVLDSMASASAVRREAALDALFSADCSVLDGSLVTLVQALAALDESESVRDTAQAVVEKCNAGE